VQVGIHILKNSARSALAIAAVTGCDFIRVGFPANSTLSSLTLQESEPSFLLRERERLGVPVSILADLATEEIEGLSLDGVEGRVTSARTTSLDHLKLMSKLARAGKVPLYLSDGITLDKLSDIIPWVDGIILDSALRKNDRPGSSLDLKRAQEFARIVTKAGRRKRRVNEKNKKGSRKSSS
jgi:predicted TIM-barrel enzyme